MLETNKIEKVARKIIATLPKGISRLGEDLDKKLREILQFQLGKLNLVSREEFDTQIQVLLRTREKMVEMKKRIEKLEKQLANNRKK